MSGTVEDSKFSYMIICKRLDTSTSRASWEVNEYGVVHRSTRRSAGTHGRNGLGRISFSLVGHRAFLGERERVAALCMSNILVVVVLARKRDEICGSNCETLLYIGGVQIPEDS